MFGKKKVGNKKDNDNGGAADFPEIAWLLPLIMIGAMLGSLAGAGFGLELGNRSPFGPAVIGAILGMLVVGFLGWLLGQYARPG